MVDTLNVVQSAADSLAQAVGTQVGTEITTWITLGLSLVTTFLVNLAKKALTAFNSAPDPVKALVAVAFAQLATWITVKTGLVVDPDINSLTTTVSGLTVALGAMGAHAVTKTFTTSNK